MTRTPRFNGLASSSPQASAAARGASRKTDTKPERTLRQALWRNGLRYRKNLTRLPGTPDIVFLRAQVVVFVDGDFWHGKDWAVRQAKLRLGHNGPYWVRKIERNIERDRKRDRQLQQDGWTILRVWESDIRDDVNRVVHMIEFALSEKTRRPRDQQHR